MNELQDQFGPSNDVEMIDVMDGPLITDDMYQQKGEAEILPTIDHYDAIFHPQKNPIYGSTLAELLESKRHNVLVIDARFGYEYQAGHIKGAINVDYPQKLQQLLYDDLNMISQNMKKKTILVFHCEFSEVRGPRLWQTLRDVDRQVNYHNYPKLFYSESYLL